MAGSSRLVITLPIKRLDLEGALEASRELWALPAGVDYVIWKGLRRWTKIERRWLGQFWIRVFHDQPNLRKGRQFLHMQW